MIERRYVDHIAAELAISSGQVSKTIELLEGGAAAPFIARYRKDPTGNLREDQIEIIAENYHYFIGLQTRCESLLNVLGDSGALNDELKNLILSTFDKTVLDDMFLPYRKKRQSKATLAHEAGLGPLADLIWAHEPTEASVQEMAAPYINPSKGLGTTEEVITGALHIIAHRISETPDLRAEIRERMWKGGRIVTKATKLGEQRKSKYGAFYNFSESIATISFHKYLAIVRGAKEGVILVELQADDANITDMLEDKIIRHQDDSPFTTLLKSAIQDAYGRLLRPLLESEIMTRVKERSDAAAIAVFRENARNLFLTPPAGALTVAGICQHGQSDCVIAIVNPQGQFLESSIIALTTLESTPDQADQTLLANITKHKVQAIAMGNGSGSKVFSGFIQGFLDRNRTLGIFSAHVNETGASAYAASEAAQKDHPDADLIARMAISNARRLQDPLAEFTKLDPRTISVGQFQHDVNQKKLREGLQRTLESVVNYVGVDLNSASASHLKYVCGIQESTAESIVAFRAEHDGFTSREQLLEVKGIGPKVYQQCAGFLRIKGGSNALDATAIHPDAYSLIESIASTVKARPADLIANPDLVNQLDINTFANETYGVTSLKDMRAELLRPGRDPRTPFRIPRFLDSVNDVGDLVEGMELEGVVTNVTDFGAFLDIGVNQDGLVHLSELSNDYVQDPRQVVKVGDIVSVKVIKVEKDKPRISLSIRALHPVPERKKGSPQRRRQQGADQKQDPPHDGAHKDARRPHQNRRDKPVGRDGGPSQKRGVQRQQAQRKRQAPTQPTGDTGKAVNTLLADQLALLREKLGGE